MFQTKDNTVYKKTVDFSKETVARLPLNQAMTIRRDISLSSILHVLKCIF